ncbi:MAG: putative nitrogen fixation protein NifT [Coleofasciculaceae cyanobacterium]
MKVMLRNNDAGTLLAYVAKKDLEEPVVEQTEVDEGTILTLANGWKLSVPKMGGVNLPQTVEARRLSS